jgi:hypothetical protein
MTSANDNDYFPSPSESIDLSRDQTQVLGVSTIDKIDLIMPTLGKSAAKDGVENFSIRYLSLLTLSCRGRFLGAGYVVA